MKITFLEDELWWCGKVMDGIHMPISGRDSYCVDFSDISPNQGAPLLLSSKGRWIWSETPYTASFDGGIITIDDDASVRLDTAGASLSDAYRAAMQAHFPFYGQINPACFQHPVYCTWIEMGYEPTQEKVLAYAKGILEHQLPAGTIIIDDHWMDSYGSWDFHYRRFPDPKGMIRRLHEMGFFVMLWFCPYVVPSGMPFLDLQKRRMLVEDDSGSAKLFRWWNGTSALLDVSNPETVEYIREKLQNLTARYGVDGFKFDAGRPEPAGSGLVRHTPLAQNEDCRLYSALGTEYPMAEYRESWKMGGAPLLMRQQDKRHSWDHEGLLALIPNGIVQSLCGYAYHCPDMVGGGELSSIDSETEIDQELYVRYLQVSVLFPILQFSLLPYKKLDSEHLACCMEALALRDAFMPYLTHCFALAAASGEPILAPLAYHAPHQGLDGITQAFWLGGKYIVYPVTEKGATQLQVKLPCGTFRDQNGQIYTASPQCQSFQIPCDLHTICIFERL